MTRAVGDGPGSRPGAAGRSEGSADGAGLLVACMGNVLRGDDGFGVAVARALEEHPSGRLPEGVETVEVGIGGMHLVQKLMEGYDGLVLVDAVDRGAAPGTDFVLEPQVPELEELPEEERRGVLAETHHTVPARVLVMARALGSLPEEVRIVGCQPGDGQDPGMELSPPVAAAVPRAVARIEALAEEFVRRRRFVPPGEGGVVREGEESEL